MAHKDAVYNLSRAALVPAAFCEGRHDLLAIATEDKLHQPYRMPLMPGSKRCSRWHAVRGKGCVCIGCRSHRDGGGRKAEAEKLLCQLVKGWSCWKAWTDVKHLHCCELDADNTGATVE